MSNFLSTAKRISNTELKVSSYEELVERLEEERKLMDCSPIHVENYNKIRNELRWRNKYSDQNWG